MHSRKGEDLFWQCVNVKYKDDRNYSQILMTIWIHINEEMYLLLERAEKEGKKLDLVEPNLEIHDSYQIENVIIV